MKTWWIKWISKSAWLQFKWAVMCQVYIIDYLSQCPEHSIVCSETRWFSFSVGVYCKVFWQNYAAQTRTIHLQIEQFNLLPFVPADILEILHTCPGAEQKLQQKRLKVALQRHNREKGGARGSCLKPAFYTQPHTKDYFMTRAREGELNIMVGKCRRCP